VPNIGPIESAKPTRALQEVSEPVFDDVELQLDENAARHFPKDRYIPIQELGRGASSTVYLCRDKLLRKRVAVKILKNLSGAQLVAFQNEARSTSHLQHPVILTLLDFGPTEGGAPYMVQEYFAGITLQHYFEQYGPLTKEQFYRVFTDLAEALGHAHSKNVMHRDIKPSNILVNVSELQSAESDNAPVRLIDFGLASFFATDESAEEKRAAQSASIVGTPAYMAPDAARSGTYDVRSEIYSLGCVMFESLTGRQPFQADTALELLQLHANAQPPMLRDVTGTDWESQFEQLIARCLDKFPENRFANTDELRTAIDDLPLPQSGSVAPSAHAAFETSSQIPSHSRRLRGPARAIIFGAVLLIVGALAFVTLNRNAPEKPKPVKTQTSEEPGDHLAQLELKEINKASEKTPRAPSAREKKKSEIANNLAMANRFYEGRGVPRDYPAAFKLFLDVARTGDAAAQESVGYMLERGLGVETNPAEALVWYAKSAKQGNPAAQLNLGTLYLEGRGTALNYKEALHWFELSAKQGNARSQNNIGYLYENGYGVEQSYEKARKYYRDAGMRGEPMAYVNLGYLLESGLGGKRDYQEAFRCYELASKSDIASGTRRLARLILVGHGTKIDYDEAYRLFYRAAQKGDATAMRWLGSMTLKGQSVKANKVDAFLWYQRAAALNDAEAQCQLGRMYEQGLGTEIDLKQAKHWYQESAARGEEDAAKALTALMKKHRNL